MERLADARVLLHRAVRIKQQQDRILPLFLLISRGGYACVDPYKLPEPCIDDQELPTSISEVSEDSFPSECPLNFMILSLLSLSNGTFEQKFKLFLQIYFRLSENSFNKSSISSEDISSTLVAKEKSQKIKEMRKNDMKRLTINLNFLQGTVINFHYVFHRIGLLPFQPYLDEIENSCYRAMLPFCVGDQPPSCAHMTMFEFREAIHQFCGLYYPIMRLLGLANDKANKFCSYQRNVMSPLNMLAKGLMGSFTCRLKYHIDTSRYRALLEPAHKSDIHERAFSMGENDPLLPDYSIFLRKAGQNGITNVVALDHGHMHDVSDVLAKYRFRAANKIQARVRAIIDRKYAAEEARMQAYLEAKEMALKEMRARILREFRKRDDYKDAAKLKWDAQVRMRQAKLKSTGQKVDRGETIMVMIEEAIARASEDIDVKFRKIEGDQNFPAGASIRSSS